MTALLLDGSWRRGSRLGQRWSVWSRFASASRTSRSTSSRVGTNGGVVLPRTVACFRTSSSWARCGSVKDTPSFFAASNVKLAIDRALEQRVVARGVERLLSSRPAGEGHDVVPLDGGAVERRDDLRGAWRASSETPIAAPTAPPERSAPARPPGSAVPPAPYPPGRRRASAASVSGPPARHDCLGGGDPCPLAHWRGGRRHRPGACGPWRAPHPRRRQRRPPEAASEATSTSLPHLVVELNRVRPHDDARGREVRGRDVELIE